MGKLLPVATGVVGITTATVTPICLTLGGSSSENPSPSEVSEPPINQEQPQPKVEAKKFTNPSWNHNSIPNLGSAKNIQKQTVNLPCISEYFKEIDWNDGKASSGADFNDIQEFPNDDNITSCLIVEYYKQTYEGSSWWWGEFRLIWSLKDAKNKQGFLTVVDVKTKDQELYGNSVAYVLKQGENKWTVSHSKERGERKFEGDVSLGNLIPTPGYEFMAEQLGDFWGFEANSTWICESEEQCPESKATTKHNTLNWKISKGGTWDNIGNWCQNLRAWLENNFGWGSFVDKISKVMGKWEKQEQKTTPETNVS